jgi:hypothetical protein
MKRLMVGSLAIGSLLFLLAAKGDGGCGVQYQPGDGTSATWDSGTVPTPNARPEPMTCSWLEGNNCWKRLVTKGLQCAEGVSTRGTFAADRKSCTYPGKGTWQFDGAVDTPSAGNTLLPIVNWRITDPSGAPCMTGKVLAAGRTMVDVQGEVALFENLSLTHYRVTCPDGTSFENRNADGSSPEDGGAVDASAGSVCPGFGAFWLQKKAPGVLMSCRGTERRCDLELWGGPQGMALATSCGW